MQKLIELYTQWKGAEPANVQQIPGGGSNRTYYRLTDTDGKSVVGVIGTSRDEDHAFIYLTPSASCLTSRSVAPAVSTSPTAIRRLSSIRTACSLI